MATGKKYILLFLSVLLIVVLINSVLIKAEYINGSGLHWCLMLAVPLLFIIMHYARKKYKILHFRSSNENRQLKQTNYNLHNSSKLFSPANSNDEEPTVLFGNSFCSQPYLSGIICNEIMHAKRNPVNTQNKTDVLNRPASLQQIDTGLANDIIWQIVPGYPGCSNGNSNFNPAIFSANAMQPVVKMIELKLTPSSDKRSYFTSHGAGASAATHTAFSTAEGMAMFVDSLRHLSAGKPVGIRLSITGKKAFHEICYAFRKTGIIPDYIVVEDGNEENNSSQNVGMPLYEALLFVSRALEMHGLEKEIKVVAATNIDTAFDVLKLYALGADALRMKSPADNRQINAPGLRIQTAPGKIIKSTREIMKNCGYVNMKQITLPSLLRKLDALQSKTINKRQSGVYPKLKISHLFLSVLLICLCA